MFKRIFHLNIRYAILILWQLVTYVELIGNQTNIIEFECLRELPVDHLLKIRRALQLLSIEDNGDLMLDDGGGNIGSGRYPIGEAQDVNYDAQDVTDDAQKFNYGGAEVKALPLMGGHLK